VCGAIRGPPAQPRKHPPNLSATEMAARYKTDLATISRAIRLNFLPPKIVERILSGAGSDRFSA